MISLTECPWHLFFYLFLRRYLSSLSIMIIYDHDWLISWQSLINIMSYILWIAWKRIFFLASLFKVYDVAWGIGIICIMPYDVQTIKKNFWYYCFQSIIAPFTNLIIPFDALKTEKQRLFRIFLLQLHGPLMPQLENSLKFWDGKYVSGNN